MNLQEAQAKIAELERQLAELTAAKKTSEKPVADRDAYGCRANTAGYEINKVIAGFIQRNRKLDPDKIYQALGGQISLRRVKQQIPYLKGRGLI
jgi:hypothetical protein